MNLVKRVVGRKEGGTFLMGEEGCFFNPLEGSGDGGRLRRFLLLKFIISES